MGEKKTVIKVEERFFFMVLLTFIGGFSNAYSYFTRGGAFVSFHTGNITKVGLSAVLLDSAMFWSAFIPIVGAFLGAIFAQLVKLRLSRRSTPFWQCSALAIELAVFLIVGFVPKSWFNDGVNFVLSFVMMFQLSNFRSIEGSVHNTTIETGNLRSLGQHCGDLIWKRDLQSLKKSVRYFVAVAAFPVGALVGGVLCQWTGIYAIWACCMVLGFLLYRLRKSYGVTSQQRSLASGKPSDSRIAEIQA